MRRAPLHVKRAETPLSTSFFLPIKSFIYMIQIKCKNAWDVATSFLTNTLFIGTKWFQRTSWEYDLSNWHKGKVNCLLSIWVNKKNSVRATWIIKWRNGDRRQSGHSEWWWPKCIRRLWKIYQNGTTNCSQRLSFTF